MCAVYYAVQKYKFQTIQEVMTALQCFSSTVECLGASMRRADKPMTQSVLKKVAYRCCV